jgi:hypothetical protein
MKTRQWLAPGALVLATATAVLAQPVGGSDVKVPAGFERFKALAGEWVAAEDSEMVKKGDLVARYAVTAAGSAVVETIFPGTPHEMVTVYHPDGKDLVLTHYCMAGNQPHMRARATAGSRVEFAFDGGTNMDPRHDTHMHSASLEFVGADEIRSEWNELEGGKPKMTVRLHLARRRS